MSKLTRKQLRARDARRDLNAEILEATDDLAEGRVGRVHVPNKDGGFTEFEVTRVGVPVAESVDAAVEAEWAAEIRRRIASLDAGAPTTPWYEARKRIAST